MHATRSGSGKHTATEGLCKLNRARGSLSEPFTPSLLKIFNLANLEDLSTTAAYAFCLIALEMLQVVGSPPQNAAVPQDNANKRMHKSS